KLIGKTGNDSGYEKLRIEYLLDRISRTSYNFVRNGETHNAKSAVTLMRYKWTKFRGEASTAEDFVANIASGSRTSGEPYYMKANDRYYLVKDVLLFELNRLKTILEKNREGKVG